MKQIGWAVELLKKDGRPHKKRRLSRSPFYGTGIIYAEKDAKREVRDYVGLGKPCRWVEVFVE